MIRRVLVLAAWLPVLAAAAPPPLTVYSDRHHERDAAVFAGFTAEMGMQVTLVDAETDELFDRLAREGANSPADLVILVGAASLSRLAERGVLAPAADDPPLRAVPEALRDPRRRWVGLGWWARCVAYRKDRFQAEDIGRYEDLGDPKFQGALLVRSASSPYNHALAAAMIAADGVEDTAIWARGVVANLARPPQGGDSDQLQALADGEGGVAIVNTRYWARFAGSDKIVDQAVLDGLGLVCPNQADRGAAADLVGTGIVRTAPHAKAAQLLLDYLLRADIQATLAAAEPDFPARPDAAVAPPLKALGSFKADFSAVRSLGKLDMDAQQVLGAAGWE
ncbi:MAG TPA: extracellular solute-binding protein [Stellaceae bacterium]|nr:extracellular solute-binding protein [Stellaceae bacterium]